MPANYFLEIRIYIYIIIFMFISVFIFMYIYMPCVKFLTDQYRSYSPPESPEQRCVLPGSTVRSAQCHLVCDCVFTTPVVNHIVPTKVRHLSPWQTFFRCVFEHKALENTCEYFAF